MTTRVKISWDDFKADSISLANAIRDVPSIGIMAIARGGLIPATIIAHALEIRNVKSIHAESYDTKCVQHTIRIDESCGSDEPWIIVDDIIDTGATAIAVLERFPNSILVATYAKPDGIDKLTLAGCKFYFKCMFEQTTWIDFPWEISVS